MASDRRILVQADNLGSHGYRHLQAHGIKFGAAGGTKSLHQPIARVLHQFAVRVETTLGAKKRAVALRCFWWAAVLKENRRMGSSGKALEQFSPESRLAHAVATQRLAHEIEVLDTDRRLGEMVVDATRAAASDLRSSSGRFARHAAVVSEA